MYLAFEKNGLFPDTWSSKMLTYSYTALWLLIVYTHFLLLVADRYRSQFIEYQEIEQPQKIYA